MIHTLGLARRVALVCLAAALGSVVLPAQPIGEVLRQYCYACHNAATKTAGFALEDFDAANPTRNIAAAEAVVHKLNHRQMPPVGMPRPDAAIYEAIIKSLVNSLDSSAEQAPKPGRTASFRRLNRTEYRNAIRDLLAVDVDVSSILPRDESSNGFDNITVGELSPTLLEGYLAAARKISRLAVGAPVRSPGGETIVVPADLTQEQHMAGLPFGTRGGTATAHTFPLDGEYEIRVVLSRNRNEQVEGLREPFEVELSMDGRRLSLFPLSPPTTRDHSDADKHLVVRQTVSAGPHEIAATFLRKSSALLETERQPYLARFNMDRHPRAQPAVYAISINGPFASAGPGDTPSRRQIFTCQPADESQAPECAKEILARLLRRAYRRPVTAADIDPLLEFYRRAKPERGFEGGIEMALRALLVSPEFLFRIEQDPPGIAPRTPYRVPDLALASRLSFFLWSTIPDDELLATAERGELHDDAVLEAQVKRMLADDRAAALTDSFAAQWLYLRNLDGVNPDRRLFPDFDQNLRYAFRRETELLFADVVEQNRSVLDLLNADYTFVNERLAKHYGIPHVYGSHFRRIDLPADSVRGGLLGQGSMLAVTSYANRTSPVIRGKWILTNILGAPPAPPPPNVPALDEKRAATATLTGRELLAAHRANPACAGCHNIMDPVGFAFENFDAIGRWRTQDGGLPVDPSGTLPDGAEFDGPASFRAALLRRPQIFASTVSEKLLTYALGRGLEPSDMPALRKIVKQAASDDYRFSTLIHGVAKSTPFQMRTSE